MKLNNTLIRVAGFLCMIATIFLMLYLLLNLGTIFFTPNVDGQGSDYYDLYHDNGYDVSVTGILFLLIPLLLLFYPWLKLFAKMAWLKSREGYYGLFVAGNTFLELLSISLTIVNVVTIIFLAYKSEQDVAAIQQSKEYGAYSCPDNSLSYIGYLLAIIPVWGGINMAYALYSIFKAKIHKTHLKS